MSLDDVLARILKEGVGSILIVDDICDVDSKHGEAYSEHIENEENLEVFIRKKGLAKKDQIWPVICDVGHEKVQNPEAKDSWYSTLKEFKAPVDLILVSSNFDVIKPVDSCNRSSATVKKLKSEFPGVEIIYFTPSYDSEALSNAMEKVLPIFVAPEAYGVMEQFDFGEFPTLMHYLCYKLTGKSYGRRVKERLSSQQHAYKNSMWKEYVKHIDKSLRSGNSQTETDYRFIILSDREIALIGDYQPSANEKVEVRGLEYTLNDEDIEKCAAIFLDNSWDHAKHKGALGDGIKRLRELRAQLDNKGRSIPIIYQSGHSMSAFTVEEKAEIESLGAVLATKDVFPKVYKGKELAEKEIYVEKIASRNPSLYSRLALVQNFNRGKPIGSDGLFVVCSKLVESKSDQSTDVYLDRMQTLAMLHTEFKDQVENEKFSAKIEMFKRYSQLVKRFERLESSELEGFAKLYSRISRRRSLNEITLVAHNDTKWDNWFGGTDDAPGRTLGDFGDASAGNEYRDLARALLDMESGFKKVKDTRWVKEKVAEYIRQRSAIDSEFKVDEKRFLNNVYSMIFVESFREASKKSASLPEISKQLLEVAKSYCRHLS